MVEKLFVKWIPRIKAFIKQANEFRIKSNMVAIIGGYFICVLIILIVCGVININYSLQYHKEQKILAVTRSVNQAAISIRKELESIYKMSDTLYEESDLIIKRNSTKNLDDINNELDTITKPVFKLRKDISGMSIHGPEDYMFSLANLYSPYYFLSGTKSRYDELIAQKKDDVMLIRSENDMLGQSMLAVKFYLTGVLEPKYTIIALEKNWEANRELFKELGLAENGSIVLTNDVREILMFFRKENAIGDEDLIRRGKFTGDLMKTSGMLETQAHGEDKYIFYDRSVGSGCTLFYVADSNLFLHQEHGEYYVIILASLLLLLITFVVIILFIKYIYRPITNVESALHAIVNGETDLKLKNIQEKSEKHPMYDNLNSLIIRLKQLIDSEYTAGIMKKQAEIDALQSQINPHFLYNTLESIRGQAIVQGVSGIEKMVKAMADIFRYSITNKNAMVTLEEEIKNIDNYLNIQQFRFNNKFIVIKELEEDTLSCLIPKLTLQPLVENTIIHGLEIKPGKGTIKISSELTIDSIIIRVEDDGVGIDQQTLELINTSLAGNTGVRHEDSSRIGLGLNNINQRIKLIFGDRYGLHVYSMKDICTIIELRVPKTSR